MRIDKYTTINAEFGNTEDMLLGVQCQTAICDGCGGEAILLRFGFVIGEIYLTKHKHS